MAIFLPPPPKVESIFLLAVIPIDQCTDRRDAPWHVSYVWHVGRFWRRAAARLYDPGNIVRVIKYSWINCFWYIILCDCRDAPWHVSCGASVRSGEYCLWVKIFVVLVSAVAWHVWRYTQKHPLYVACIEGGEM